LVLDIEGASRNPGAHVITWNRKPSDNDNQQWYDDPSTGTIRSKLTDMCLDVEGGVLVMKPFQYGDPNQQWERSGNHIRNRQMANKVLDISGNKREPGAKLCSWDHHGGENQKFDFDFVDGQPHPPPGGHHTAGPYPPGGPSGYPQQPGAYPPQPGYQGGYPSYPVARRDFLIVSQMNGKVLDIARGNTHPGAEVIVYRKHSTPQKNQLWYIDPQGILRSALNDLTFSASDNGHQLKMVQYTGDPHQQWYIDGNKIMNRTGSCLDIKGANGNDGAEAIPWNYKGSNNQHWTIEYV
jgi:hypothetical protein